MGKARKGTLLLFVFKSLWEPSKEINHKILLINSKVTQCLPCVNAVVAALVGSWVG